MKKYINTSNYYLSTITSVIPNSWINWTFDVSDVTVDWVTLPTEGYYWVDVDFGDTSKREIFRIVSRTWYTLTYDARISPYGKKTHSVWATVWLRDFSQLLNSLSTNTDNFWEIEIVWEANELNILVRWGNVFLSWRTNEYTTVNNTPIHLDINSEVYIVLKYHYDEDLNVWVYSIDKVSELADTWMYLLWKVTTNATSITSVQDLRSTMVWWGWEWDMKWPEWTAIFNPDWLAEWQTVKDAFDMDNMKQGINKLYITPSEHNKYDDYESNKQDTLVSWSNIVTINGRSIIDVSQWEWGNIPLDTILTAWWKTYTTNNWAETFTFPEPDYYPINEDAFMVFTDSGTILIKWWENPNDYTYDETTHTITFNSPLYEDEHAVIWTMYDASDAALWIGSWVITLQRNWTTITNWQFNVNQEENQTIELWDLASNASITFTQWWVPDKTITLNQASNDTVALSWIIPVSQEDYEDLPDTKLTDNQWYFIIE